MLKNSITTGLVSALPFAFASAALAQSSIPVPSAVPQSSTVPYEISGTRISGATRTTEVILTAPVDANAAPFKTEIGLYLYPTAFAGFGYNSNVSASSSAAVGSSFINLAPQLVAEMKNKGDRYTALASVDTTRYADSSQDNYTNSEFTVAGDNYFNSRARAGWSIGRVDGSDPRVALRRDTLNQWHTTNLKARLIYGAPEASGRVEVDLGNQVKTYENYRASTERLDLTLNSVAGRFFYRLGTRTLALAEVRNAKADYASALASASNNTERRYYAGLTWEATAATTGIVKVGRMTKDFDQAGTDDFSGNSWEASVRWLPLSYSAVELQSARSTSDSLGVGNFELKTSHDVIWNHQWTRSLTSRVAVGSLKTEFVGAARQDSAVNYALTLDYAVLRWLKIGVDWAATDNSSTDPNAAYRRYITMFTLNASL